MRSVSGASASASEPTIHLAVAVADRERAAAPRADQEVVVAGEQQRQGEGALEARQRRLGGRAPGSCRCAR